MKVFAVVFLSALAGLTPAGVHAQSDDASGEGAALHALNEQIAKFQKAGHKGWTCRDPEDGKRMHRLDPTNIAHMGKVPSTERGFLDNDTPLASLPVCSEAE